MAQTSLMKVLTVDREPATPPPTPTRPQNLKRNASLPRWGEGGK